jgi:hypothetical protein
MPDPLATPAKALEAWPALVWDAAELCDDVWDDVLEAVELLLLPHAATTTAATITDAVIPRRDLYRLIPSPPCFEI